MTFLDFSIDRFVDTWQIYWVTSIYTHCLQLFCVWYNEGDHDDDDNDDDDDNGDNDDNVLMWSCDKWVMATVKFLLQPHLRVVMFLIPSLNLMYSQFNAPHYHIMI